MQKTLGSQIRAAYVWTTILQLTRNLAGFGLSLLLARFLEPKDYGLVGMVTVLTSMLSVLQDWGIGQAVVYFEEKEEYLPTYFTVTAVTGACLTLLTVLAAPVVAAFYREPRLVPMMQVLSVTLLLGSLRSISRGLLTKRLLFRKVTIAEGACTIFAAVVAIVLAARGFGAWSLVVNILLGSFLQTILFAAIIRPRFTFNIDRVALKQVLGWGLPWTGATILWQFWENSDYLVIGRILGPIALGQYTMAYRLATVTNDKISSVINNVSFPSFSAMQDDRAKVVEHWFSLTQKLALITLPILVAVALNAEDFIAVALGAKWLEAAPVVKILCLMGALKTFSATNTNLVSARGRTDLLFQFNLLCAVLLPASFALGCWYGSLMGVAFGWCVVYPFVCLFLAHKVVHLLGVRLWDYLATFALPVGVAAVCLAAMLPVSWLMTGGLVRLCVRGGIGLAAFAACVLFQPSVRQSAWQIVGYRQKPLAPA